MKCVHVRIGRVAQRDLVKSEVVGAVHAQQAHVVLLLVEHLGLVRQIPPGDLLAKHLCAATAVNCALTHDAAVGCVFRGDQRLAAMSFFGENSATSGRHIVVAWIARGKQCGAGIHQERNPCLELERSAEKYIPCAIGMQPHGFARSAMVDGALNPRSVQLAFVGKRELTIRSGEPRTKHCARGRIVRLNDVTRVLGCRSSASGQGKSNASEKMFGRHHGLLDRREGGAAQLSFAFAGCGAISMLQDSI